VFYGQQHGFQHLLHIELGPARNVVPIVAEPSGNRLVAVAENDLDIERHGGPFVPGRLK
jgi:hypothetical protein